MLVAPFILFFGTNAAPPADTTPPVIASIVVTDNGSQSFFVVDFTETGSPPILSDFPSAGLAMHMTGGAVTLGFGSFTGSNELTFTSSRRISLGETGTGDYDDTLGDIQDSVGNLMVSVSGVTIDNQSSYVSSTLTAPVLSHAYSTRTAIHLAWTDATGGAGSITYTVLKNASAYAAGVTSPYDASTGLDQLTLYSFTVRASDGVTTATSNAVAAGLEYDGTATGTGGDALESTCQKILRVVQLGSGITYIDPVTVVGEGNASEATLTKILAVVQADDD